MNSAQRLLDALVRYKGEHLVIGSDEPPFIWREEKKGYLMRSPLNDDLIRRIDAELEEVFAGREWLTYMGQEIGRSSENGRIRLQVASVLPEALIPRAPAAAAQDSLDGLLHAMVEKRASDLHLTCGSAPMLRVDGDMGAMAGLPAVDEAWLREQI